VADHGAGAAAGGAARSARAAVIAFGVSIAGAEAYRRYGEPGVRRAREADSEVFAFASVEPVARTYNLILEAAAGHGDLEALVLVHPHTEIAAAARFAAEIRRVLADPAVGVVGCAGARHVGSIAWWEGEVVCGEVVHRYEEHHGGQLPALSWARHEPPPAEVEVLDGQLLVLAPWVVRNLRFDEELVLGHGFDLDFSLRVRQAGRKLVVADLPVIHHRSLELVGDLPIWVEAHIAVAEKWGAVLDGEEVDWKRRARRAEARREAARAIAFSESMKLDARVLELERRLEALTGSGSWRATAPLRALNERRRRRLAARTE
jgi:Glycosyltransferase like family